MLEKLILATVTPFQEDGSIDFDAQQKLIELWRRASVTRFFICGTTGEMLHLSIEERKQIVEFYMKNKKDSETVCVHIGGVDVDSVIELGTHAFSQGADSVSIVTPHYYKVSQEALIEFYTTAIKGISLEKEIYLYNIPQCASNDILPSTLATLADRFPNIKGLKYSFFDMNRMQEYIFAVSREFQFLSGTDHMAAALSMLGVHGTVSGAASVYPEIFVEYLNAVDNNDKSKILAMQKCITDIVVLLGYGNMSIFKELLARRGLCTTKVRSPLVALNTSERDVLFKNIEKWEKEASKFVSFLK